MGSVIHSKTLGRNEVHISMSAPTALIIRKRTLYLVTFRALVESVIANRTLSWFHSAFSCSGLAAQNKWAWASGHCSLKNALATALFLAAEMRGSLRKKLAKSHCNIVPFQPQLAHITIHFWGQSFRVSADPIREGLSPPQNYPH